METLDKAIASRKETLGFGKAGKERTVAFRVSEQLANILEAQAKENQMRVSDILRIIVTSYFIPTISRKLIEMVKEDQRASAMADLEAYFTAEEAEEYANYLYKLHLENMDHYRVTKEETLMMMKIASRKLLELADTLEAIKLPNFEDMDHENG